MNDFGEDLDGSCVFSPYLLVEGDRSNGSDMGLKGSCTFSTWFLIEEDVSDDFGSEVEGPLMLSTFVVVGKKGPSNFVDTDVQGSCFVVVWEDFSPGSGGATGGSSFEVFGADSKPPWLLGPSLTLLPIPIFFQGSEKLENDVPRWSCGFSSLAPSLISANVAGTSSIKNVEVCSTAAAHQLAISLPDMLPMFLPKTLPLSLPMSRLLRVRHAKDFPFSAPTTSASDPAITSAYRFLLDNRITSWLET